MERWLPVLDFEDLYEVSDHANVLSLRRGIILSPHRSGSLGYWTVNLSRNGQKFHRRIHVLVAEAFIEPRPPGLEVCHGPAGMEDNTPGNLRWDTHQSNVDDIDWTYCRRGLHEMTGDNVYTYNHGGRQCKACAKETRRRRRSGS